MESYQTAGVIISVIGIILGLILANFIAPLGGLMFVVNIIALILSAAMKPRSHRTYGIVTMVLAVIGNLLLLIPGIMALRYKKEIPTQRVNYSSDAINLAYKKYGYMNRWAHHIVSSVVPICERTFSISQNV